MSQLDDITVTAQRLRTLEKEVEAARRRLHLLIVEAVEQGASQRMVARAAGLSQSRICQLVGRQR
jgi:hypothetical protein